MSNYQKPKYEVQVLEWSEFTPVENQKWICAGGFADFRIATDYLSAISHLNSYLGYRVVLADPKGWKDEA